MNKENLIKIEHDNVEYAIIIKANYHSQGIEFFTDDSYSQQLAYMNRPAGYSIQPHIHNEVKREVYYTNEVLFVKKGRMRVDFYNSSKIYISSMDLSQGDVILLTNGGHGFYMYEDVEMIEVKQGPYAGVNDKTKFNP